MSEEKILIYISEYNNSESNDFLAEASALEVWHGPNIYSKFLKKHGARPNRVQAAVIGTLMGTRVLASDGSKQPTAFGQT